MRVAATSAVIFKLSASLAMAPVMQVLVRTAHRLWRFAVPVWQVFAVGENDTVAHHTICGRGRNTGLVTRFVRG